MKKILLVVAMLASLQIANAQTSKAVSSARKQVESALAASQDAKKAANFATWMKLGKAYADTYNAAQGNGFVGTTVAELNLLMGNTKPLAVEGKEIGGVIYTVQHYETADYYIVNDAVVMILVTSEDVSDYLSLAADAYAKAAELDTKGKKTKDLSEALKNIANQYSTDAVSAYQLQDYSKSSELFAKSAEVSLIKPYAVVDTSSIYNSGLTAAIAGNLEKAKEMFEECVKYDYYGDDGDVFARLASIYEQEGDKEKSLQILEKGFISFPRSQSILIGLINAYNTEGGNTDRLFELLDVAKQNEPTNASLWYVEGDIRLKMDPPQVEQAFAAYDKCSEIDPNYAYGHIGKGIYLYNRAADISEKASLESDDNKYWALVEQFQESLKACIEPFEKAYEVSSDEGIKLTVAEYIKNAAFRFREDPKYLEIYEKYDAIVAAGKE